MCTIAFRHRPNHSSPTYLPSHNTAVVYNDEKHTFDEVIRAFTSATHRTTEMAQLWAFRVDNEGRAAVKVGRVLLRSQRLHLIASVSDHLYDLYLSIG